MDDMDTGRDKREFLRYSYNKPLKYSTVNVINDRDFISKLTDAISKNLSASGILFITNVGKIPDISSIIVLDLDFRTTNVCQEIEKRALILNNKLVGRVVRIEDNEDGTFGVGVAFIKKSDNLSKDIATLIK